MQLDYDKKQTLKNVREFLRHGQKIRTVYQSSLSIRSHSDYSLAPSFAQGDHSKQVEKAALLRVEAKEEWQEIESALDAISEEEKQLLMGKYLAIFPVSTDKFCIELNVSERTFYRMLNKALEEFAFCYRGGELVAWTY
ncbi:ArpU family phage packaging/lysis transcriptional regulator [Enterococcus sp. CSURQ0835]|uniref:ArpU family phage packaging/lysis transcriptional regulator n=1 Tax=Enterococcus sp. CSURQ0835 TaxID=2681394 RepID=UPI001F3BD4C7|nr:ArpU family phage packaging/lysis transcriptional regulator [Enterococcus sp. CSURQ0835]